MSRPRRPLRHVALLTAAALALPLAASFPQTVSAAGEPAQACPPGTALMTKSVSERAFERAAGDEAFADLVGTLDQASADRAATCQPLMAPEPFLELAARQATADALSAGPLGVTPPGALRAALAGKAAASAAASSVPGASGAFRPVGTTPLIADDPNAPNVNLFGLGDLAGRIDSYTYDAVNRRLFAAFGTGGVWMSRDTGKTWRSVADSLPFQSVGAVAWSPDGRAADGTLLVVSGEASAGGNVYTGLGAFYSTDSGTTWQQSRGIPDGLMGFEIEVDPTNPKEVYAATSQGLYRSTDAGRTYVNVALPTGDCAGVTGYDNVCQNANWVTDVEIKAPGGVGADKRGGQVLAVVGYRAGRLPYPGTDTPQSPANGLYRSDTGAPGSFTVLDVSGDGTTPVGFAPQERIGRTELGAATGPGQDHDFVYAIVQDAVLFNGGVPAIDAFDDTTVTGGAVNNTAFNGVYVSSDFGGSWTRMADEVEIQSPVTGSAFIGAAQALFNGQGIQAWYNMYIKPDPTSATASGVPTRLVFGLEEVWATRLEGTPQDGVTQAAEPVSFKVVGPYFADESCQIGVVGSLTGVAERTPFCPNTQTFDGSTTTHPDQQDAIWVPGPDGSVTLVAGNDGGNYTQTRAAGQALSKDDWGRGDQAGFGANTLLPYDASAAKDGTVVFGLQDNGSGHVRPDGRVIETFGGDGFYAAVDPDDSKTYYNEVTNAGMRVTTDGGVTYTDIRPPVSAPMFSNPFTMDPTDADHLLTAGPEVVERTQGPEGDWVEVFNTGEGTQMSAVELYGAAAYVGFCSTCDIVNKDPEAGQVFESGLATNVGGNAPAKKGSPDGWHQAAAKGLPDRYITGIAIDPVDPRTVYVSLANYANRQWWPVGSFNDANPDVGEGHVYKSTDAGETFTDISGNLPDVPARSIEINRGQLVLGTDVGMFLSNNADGQRWTAPAGLPSVPVVSVKNVPGTQDRLVLATFGRGIYEYTFSRRAGSAAAPVVAPGAGSGAGSGAAAPVVAGGRLPATGLPVALGGAALVALLGGLALRRRTA